MALVLTLVESWDLALIERRDRAAMDWRAFLPALTSSAPWLGFAKKYRWTSGTGKLEVDPATQAGPGQSLAG